MNSTEILLRSYLTNPLHCHFAAFVEDARLLNIVQSLGNVENATLRLSKSVLTPTEALAALSILLGE